MREAISQFQLMLGRMKDFREPRMVAGEELGSIGWSDREH
jgi:hypothetical protein